MEGGVCVPEPNKTACAVGLIAHVSAGRGVPRRLHRELHYEIIPHTFGSFSERMGDF